MGFITGGPLAGVINTYLGWQSNFYITGGFCLLVTLLWIVLVFDTPEDCIRISSKELLYISSNTIQENIDEEMVPKLPPYLAMAKSTKAWAGVSKMLLAGIG